MASNFMHLVEIFFAVKGAEQAKTQVQGVNNTLTKFDQTKHDKTIKEIDTAFTGVGISAKTTGKIVGNASKNMAGGMNDFAKAMNRALIVAPVWMALRAAMMAVIQTVQTQIKFMIDLETAMARIRIVGKGAPEEFILLKDSLVALSFAYGTSATEAAQAAMIFAQQGKSVQETLYLTQQAMLAAQILGTDVVTTVDNLTAAMNGFGISGEQSIGIIDKWVSVEKEFAVTSKDLADATKVASATANQMGITLSEFLGDVTSVIEITRKSGSEAARGLSFIYARLLTTGKPVIEQLAQVKFYLDKQNIATNEVTQTMRSHASILGDLAKKWNSLTKEESLAVAESLGSKRQLTIINALMQNYTRSLEARIVALTSAGSSEKSFNIIQETTAFKLNQLSSAWNNLTNALGDTSAFKVAIDGFSSILTALTFVIDAEKGYRQLMSKPIAAERAKITATISELGNIKELIKLRNQLNENPIENAVNIKRISESLDVMMKRQNLSQLLIPAELDIQIDKKTVAAIKKDIDKVLQEEYSPKLKNLYGILELPTITPKSKTYVEKEILKVQVEYNKKLKEQKAIAIGNYTQKKLEKELEDELGITEQELIDKTKEKMDIEFELGKLKISSNDNTEQLLQKEIELTKNSQYQYNDRQRLLEVAKLENQLALAKNNTQQKSKELLIDYYTNVARIGGATESQTLQLEDALTKQLLGHRSIIDSLKYRLNMEKEITKEKNNQIDISSDSIALWKVAQKYGVTAAKEIGAFLTGGQQFKNIKNLMVAGQQMVIGKYGQNTGQREQLSILDILKENFPNIADKFLASEFLGKSFPGYGISGERYMGAPGAQIPIPEFTGIANVKEMTAQFGNLNINVSPTVISPETKEDMATTIQQDIAEAIRTDAKVKSALKEQIELF